MEKIQDPFLKKSLMLAVDGTEPQELQKMMELELDNQAEHEDQIPKVFESAGGFAPTVGIIGAVLGLIQVMQHLDDITEVGRGIAVAFVATIYGVGAANLFFLPCAGKIKLRIRAGANRSRNDAGGRDLHSGRHEPAHDRDQAAGLPRGRQQNRKGRRRQRIEPPVAAAEKTA